MHRKKIEELRDVRAIGMNRRELEEIRDILNCKEWFDREEFLSSVIEENIESNPFDSRADFVRHYFPADHINYGHARLQGKRPFDDATLTKLGWSRVKFLDIYIRVD